MFDCPVSAELEEVLKSARAFARAMRKLRRSLMKCRKCVQADSCPLLREIDQAIQTAVSEITNEMELSAYDR